MNIYSLQLGFGQEVPDKVSLNIYLTGCLNNKKCDIKNCHNQKLRNFKSGTDYRFWFRQIDDIIKENLIDCICILGGEPLDQDEKMLKCLINVINVSKYFYNKKLKIYLYSGYLYEDKKEIIDSLFTQGIDGFCLGEYDEKEYKKKWLYK